MLSFTLLALAVVQPQPVTTHIYRSHDVPAALAAGCRVQHVHTPAGKLGNAPAIIRCSTPVATLEARRAKGDAHG